MTVEVRKIRAGDPKHWSMRHSPGPKSSAGYGVFVDDEHVATISGETRGYRGHPQWIVETIGDWGGPVGQRPKRIYDTDSFVQAKAWALANEQVLVARKPSPSRHHATKKASAQLDREIAEALTKKPGAHKLAAMKKGEVVVTNDEEMDQMLALGDDAIMKVRSLPNPDRVGIKDQYIAWIGAATPPRKAGARSHATIAKLDPSQLRVGQLFDHLGHIYEIPKIGRDKNRTVSIARRVRDLFGKETLIDHRSFPARDFDRQHLQPIDRQTAENRGWPPLVR